MIMDDDTKILENALEEAKKELSMAAIGSEAERLIYRLFPQLEDDRDERIRKVLIKVVADPCIKLKSDKHELLDYLESLKDLPKRDGLYIYHNRQFQFIGAPVFEETDDICKRCENKPDCGNQSTVYCNGFKAKDSSWKPTKKQVDAFEQFVRSVGESGYASPYDENTKALYSLLADLHHLLTQ